MSKLNFSRGKFSRFISSKGFYVALVVCLIGASAATWLAVNRTINGIEDNNNTVLENETFNDFPLLEEVEKKENDIPQTSSSTAQSSSSTSSSSAEESSARPEQSEQPTASVQSPTLAYTSPVKGDIINPYSNGELVKNTTLGDWRTHDGIDIACDKGTEIGAAADGTVSNIASDPLWGTVITIDHIDGNQTVYSGLDANVPVAVGEVITARQVIGVLDGVPSEISDKSHLHFAVKNSEGKWINPMDVLSGS